MTAILEGYIKFIDSFAQPEETHDFEPEQIQPHEGELNQSGEGLNESQHEHEGKPTVQTGGYATDPDEDPNRPL